MSTSASASVSPPQSKDDDRMHAFYVSGLIQDGDDVLAEASDSDDEGAARDPRLRMQRRARQQVTSRAPGATGSATTQPQP